MTSLFRGGLPNLTSSDKGGGGSKIFKKDLTSFKDAPQDFFTIDNTRPQAIIFFHQNKRPSPIKGPLLKIRLQDPLNVLRENSSPVHYWCAYGIHLLLCSKRHHIDEIEHPPSPICGEKPQFESNVTSFQFRQNASARWWPLATTSPRRFGGDQ